MKDKIKKKKLKRFDYFQFLMDRKLFSHFCFWCEIYGFDKNSYKVRHNYLVYKGLMSDIKDDPRYDRCNVLCPGEFCSLDDLIAIVKETPYK